ncbi:DUF6114 domain-containing protein [Lentzea sp. NPDC060358]|uniref:DUF6114 domain-containing protein n=1 Tax=Lentzea sp. NPDC060358 TaxID=3347103 RepID=UPI00365AB895
MFLRTWRRFTAWRRGRPFWAGLFVCAGAILILFPPFSSLKFGDAVFAMSTFGGVSALLIGALMLTCGLSLWYQPRFRLAAGIVTVLLSLVAFVVTNFGGFILGTVCSLLGGALAVAWTDEPKKPKKAKHTGDTAEDVREDVPADVPADVPGDVPAEAGPDTTQRVHPT